jgi:hypothetical protein
VKQRDRRLNQTLEEYPLWAFRILPGNFPRFMAFEEATLIEK